MKKQNSRRSVVLLAILAGVSAGFMGCGKQAFVVAPSAQTSEAPGNFMVPPKVDILLVEDDTGSMFEAYGQVAQQIPQFLSSLQGRGWDYHFATIPLTTDRPLDQILASQYDSNWGSLWQPPYPGASPNGPGTIVSQFFRTPDNYGGFLTYGEINNSLNGSEPGFQNMAQAIHGRMPGTSFLRPDALFAVIMMGNGNDTSGVTFCTRSDGATVPCEYAGYPACAGAYNPNQRYSNCGTLTSSYNYYKSQLLASKANSLQVKFYSAVANSQSTNCLGGYSTVGTRYQKMATDLGGTSVDICSTPIPSVLDQVGSNLHAVKIAFRTRYLFIDQDADPTTIVVNRLIGGNPNNTVEIPQSATSGWTYDGYVSNVYSVDYPTPMNLASGYAIELHGSAELVGDDTASVTFKPAGAHNSSAN